MQLHLLAHLMLDNTYKFLLSKIKAEFERAALRRGGRISMKQQRKILLVEDHSDLRELSIIFLKRRGFEMLTATNGIEAIEIARSRVPDLIIMDVALPLMNGFQAAAELRKSPVTRHIPILAVSGGAFREDRKELLAHNFDDYLQKPTSAGELVSSIEALLQKSDSIRKSCLPLGFDEFKSRFSESGLEIAEDTLRRSYKGLLWLREQNDMSWEVIRAKVENLGRELKQSSQGKTFKLRAARLPLTSRDWERY
jgi:two-component system cell cycle response regulator DivK